MLTLSCFDVEAVPFALASRNFHSYCQVVGDNKVETGEVVYGETS